MKLHHIACVLVAATASLPVGAQAPVVGGTERVAFNRPEAWAMATFGSIAQLSSIGAPRSREPWSLELGIELAGVPSLDEEQRRVGFNGTKVEDLNRAPALVRPRVTIGLPGRFSAVLAWLPPIELKGMRTNLVSLGIGRPLVERPAWSLGARAFGQTGTSTGELTCTPEDASHPPGEPGNEFGCEAPSHDTASLDHLGVELVGGWRPSWLGGGELHLGVARVWHELEFQVDALTFGYRDRSRLVADGATTSVTGGVSIPISDRLRLAGELFWVPLEVRRGPDAPVTHDDLMTLRAMFSYTLR